MVLHAQIATTKDTKSTKDRIRELRALRVLRGNATFTDEASDRRSFLAASVSHRIYSKLYGWVLTDIANNGENPSPQLSR
jgi:hypothetical protein